MNSSNNLLSFKWSYRRVYQQFTVNIRRGWSQPSHGSPPAPYIPKVLWRGHRRCHAWSPSFAERIPAHNWFEGKSAGSTMCLRILKGKNHEKLHAVLYLSFNRSIDSCPCQKSNRGVVHSRLTPNRFAHRHRNRTIAKYDVVTRSGFRFSHPIHLPQRYCEWLEIEHTHDADLSLRSIQLK